MASTKKVNVVTSDQEKNVLNQQIENTIVQLQEKLKRYEKLNDKPYPKQIKETDNYDYINPTHYVQDDGKQTWEHMVDEFGLYETAIFCKLNAYKYADRRGKKPNEEVEREDKKIKWYEEKAAELFEQLDSEKTCTCGYGEVCSNCK